MIFIDVDEPVRNVWDCGDSADPILLIGSRVMFPATAGSMAGIFMVVQSARGVVLLKRERQEAF